jgi:hypothetical protein
MTWIRRISFAWFCGVLLLAAARSSAAGPATQPQAADLHPPIPIAFHLDRPGLVTLVIEDAHGVRVRNLLSETPFPAGDNTAWWDGLDDLARDQDAASHAVYHVPGKLVAAGNYRVRGIFHDPLDIKYEMTPYFPGDPPWMTGDRSSGWLANHTPPSCVCFLPAGQAPLRKGQQGESLAQVLIGSRMSEGGSGIAWIGLGGKKYHGQEWLGGVWTGAQYIAHDPGPNAVDGVYAYTVAYWEGDKTNDYKSELRINALRRSVDNKDVPIDARKGTGEDIAVLKATYKVEVPSTAQGRSRLGGLAAYNGVLVVSVPANDQLLLINVSLQQVIGSIALHGVNGVAFDTSGRLSAVAGKRIVQFQPFGDLKVVDQPPTEWATGNTPSVEVPPPTVLVRDGLVEPQQIVVDDNGDLYVSDWGDSHQIKVFSRDGKLLRRANWGYHSRDRQWKSPRDIVRALASAARNGGNLLINVGPRADGSVPDEAAQTLTDTGAWFRRNNEWLANSERSPFSWMTGNVLTVKGNTVYVHLFALPEQAPFCIAEIANRVKSVRLIDGAHSLPFEQADGGRLFVHGLPEQPDPICTTVAIEVEGSPRALNEQKTFWIPDAHSPDEM